MVKQLQTKLMLLLAVVLGGVGSAWADTYETGTLGKLSSGDNTIANVTWTVTLTGSSYFGTDSNYGRGSQFGSSNSPASNVTLTSSAFTGTITKIVVNASAYSSSATIGVTVGGTAFGTNSNLTSTNAAYTFESSATGNIVITLTNASSGGRAMYVKSISVTYSDGSQKTVAGLSFPMNSYEVDEDAEFTAPTLTNPHNLSVTYSSSDPSVATVNASTGTVTVVAPGTTTITANSEETEQYEAGEASYTLTVNTVFHIEDGVFDFEAMKSDYGSGVEVFHNSSNYVTEEKTWTAGNVTLLTAGKYRWWYNGGELRFYNNTPNSTMTFSVPDGYVITKITITGGTTFTATGYSASKGVWTGSQQTVTLTYSESSGSANVKKVVVEYGVDLSFTIGDSKWLSIAAPAFVSMPTGVTGYIVTSASKSGVKLTKIAAVTKDTPILLTAATAKDYTFEEAEDGDLKYNDVELSTNKLQVSNGSVTGGSTIFALADGTNGVGFYKVSASVTIPKGKCYLEITDGPSRSFVGFDGDATAIEDVQEFGEQRARQVYDLLGRQLSNRNLPKGLYIVNGKKVVLK